jgi:hypothetical protein
MDKFRELPRLEFVALIVAILGSPELRVAKTY